MTELLDSLRGARVHDILIPGYLDGAARFESLTWTVYLDLGVDLLRLDAVKYDGVLRMSRVPEVTMPPEWADEDETLVVGSIGSLFFDPGGRPPITRIRYAVTHADRAVVRCAEFRLGPGVCLFFDPMNVDGMRLAVNRGYEAWQRDDRDREGEIFGRYEELVWAPE